MEFIIRVKSNIIGYIDLKYKGSEAEAWRLCDQLNGVLLPTYIVS